MHPIHYPGVTKSSYRSDIDGLRGLQILALVGFHGFPTAVTGGYIGVSIFFVISGYLISTIIFKSLDKGGFDFLDFYIRRVRRIFPSLIVILIAAMAIGWFALFSGEYRQLGEYILGGALFLDNFVALREAGYFDTSSELKPLLHLWSLGIEEQFYIFWPLLAWVSWKNKFNLLTITLLVTGVSFFLNLKGMKVNPIGTFYAPWTRVWEILSGGVFAYVHLYCREKVGIFLSPINHALNQVTWANERQHTQYLLPNISSFLGMAILLYGIFAFTKQTPFPGLAALLPIAGALLIIAGGTQSWVNRQVLSNRLMVFFGLISYPLYLWHWMLLSFTRVIDSGEPRIRIKVAAIAVSIFLSWLCYKFIENPLRFGQRGSIKAAILILILAIVGAMGYWIYREDGLHNRDIATHDEQVNKLLAGTLWQYTKNENCIKNFGNTYNSWCILNEDSRLPSILLLGDSYANNLYPGLVNNPVFKNEIILNFSSCQLAPLESCDGIYNAIKNIQSVKYAFIAYRYYDANYLESEFGLTKQIEFLRKKNIKIFVLGPKPQLDYDIKACFLRPFRNGSMSCLLSASQVEEQEKQVNALIDKVLIKYPDVFFIDQNVIFKTDDGNFSFKKDDLPMIRDGKDFNHLSELGSNILSQYLQSSYLKVKNGP